MIEHTFKLLNRNPLDPRWLNSFREAEVLIEESDKVVVGDVTLYLESGQPSLPVGQRVKVWLSRWFYCETVDYVEHQKATQRIAFEQKKREQESSRKKAEKEAIDFNESLNIPSTWRPGMKDVLSGLSENSFGSGRSKATVTHIELLEPLMKDDFIEIPANFCALGIKASSGLANPVQVRKIEE